MADDLNIARGTKAEKYANLLPQLEALTNDEPDLVANCANVVAALRQTFGFFWVGVYIVRGEELVLGPFQGDIACTRIARGRGVCGTAWEKAETLIVPDVEKFPGHIACSALSKSEIVVPVIKEGSVRLILDVDSDKIDDFDKTDQFYLEKTGILLSKLIISFEKT